MRLQNVTYQVFEHEATEYWAIEPSAWHQMDGQVVLEFSDTMPLYISWGNGPLQYSIEQRGKSFFTEGVLKPVTMTHHPYWNRMIGNEFVMNYADKNHQILIINCGNDVVFLSSQ